MGNSALADPPNEQNIQDFVRAHNSVRCGAQPPPLSMPAVTWDPLLAQVAQNYAKRCVWAHNTNRTTEYANAGGSGYVGENIFGCGGYVPTAGQVVFDWAGESADYNFQRNTCSAVCGHYTQVVWAASIRIGCGHASCPNGLSGAPNLKHLVVCDYNPGGNITGQRPYQAAP